MVAFQIVPLDPVIEIASLPMVVLLVVEPTSVVSEPSLNISISRVSPAACRTTKPAKLTFDGLFADIAEMGTIFDVSAAAEILIADQKAQLAGITPDTRGLTALWYSSGTKAPYVGIIAVRAEDKDAPWVKTFIESYHSPEVKAYIEKQFKGAITPTW